VDRLPLSTVTMEGVQGEKMDAKSVAHIAIEP